MDKKKYQYLTHFWTKEENTQTRIKDVTYLKV